MITRRQLLRHAAYLTGLGIATGLYTWQIEPYWVEYLHRRLPIAYLPKSLVGKTLVQISDIHVGDRVDYGFILKHFRRTAELHPDIVVYTGDYVSYEHARQLDQLRDVMAVAPRGSLGTLAILGNHDYGENWIGEDVSRGVISVLEDQEITVLRNESHSVAGLNVIGLDDLWGPNFNPPAAFKGYQSERANLVLCHNPDVCDLDVWEGYRGWILAGHTHGGQCKPPFLPPPLLPVKNRRYTAGEFDVGGGRRLYINRALGCSWPLRFNVRPEITVFTLERA